MSKKLIQAAAGAGGESVYVEDVFSTYLYTGADANETVTNGIDLSGEGGLVWTKSRTDSGSSHLLFDTERGTGKYLQSNSTAAEGTYNPYLSSFNSDGFTTFAFAPADYASWSFRKAEKFFDVVTYTGNGTSQNIAHNLGSTPAVIFVKETSGVSNWSVYHSSLGATQVIFLNLTNSAFTSGIDNWNSTAPTDSQFSVGPSTATNTSGETYVAYLFASDAGGFGDDGSESIIKCGSYTTDANEDATINLGWEPQWLLVKRTDSSTAGDWRVIDSMRGWEAGGDAAYVEANTSDAEAQTGDGRYYLTSTGFKQDNFGANRDYIYIAIRRPMKTPESGTEVFKPVAQTSQGNVTTDFPVDMVIMGARNLTWGYNWSVQDRLRGNTGVLFTSATTSENTGSLSEFDSNTFFKDGWVTGSEPGIYECFKRATGFFDVVAYTGTSTSTRTLNHNLGAIPELIIFKRRTGTNWKVWSGDNTTDDTYFLELNLDQAEEQQNNGLPVVSSLSTTEFTVRNAIDGTVAGQLNRSPEPYIAYLFATLAGVSKVGSYTGTGSNVDVDCGFSAGARFILIKRTDSTGDWYVYDSVRGIVAGNDPYLLLNSTAAEVTSTDYIDPLSSGFTVTSSAPAGLNASGGSYLFLAIA